MNKSQSTIILCDLGDTLVKVNKFTYARDEIGFLSLIMNGLLNPWQINPQKRIFETLESIGGTQDSIIHESQPLPKLYADWMAGVYEDPVNLKEYLLKEVINLYNRGFFVSYSEYIVIYNAIKAMFSPDILIKHLVIIEPMFELLKRIDTSRHTLVAATNWDPHSFKLFLTSPTGKIICTIIKTENMIVSGYIKNNKPDGAFYDYIIERYGKDHSYLFIDNEQTNIEGAKIYDNIDLITYTGDAKKVEYEFKIRALIY